MTTYNMTIENREAAITSLLDVCNSFTAESLQALSDRDLSTVDSVDVNWCYEEWQELGYASAEQAVSSAYFDMFEEVSNRF